MTRRATSPEANVRLLRTAFESFNAGDIEACLARLTPDFVINLRAALRAREFAGTYSEASGSAHNTVEAGKRYKELSRLRRIGHSLPAESEGTD